MRSVTDGKTLHSMHSYFLRPADIGAEVRYEVELLRDGRGYSTRQVRGYQNGKPVYVCLASFAAGEPGGQLRRRTVPARASPAPRTLPSSADYLRRAASGGTMTERSKAYWSGGRSFDMRHVPGPVYLTVEGERVPHQAVWVRPVRRAAPGRRAHRRAAGPRRRSPTSATTRSSSRCCASSACRGRTTGLVTASLDHAMWFHRPAAGSTTGCSTRRRRSPPTPGAALGTGRFFTRDAPTWPPSSRRA